MINMYNVDCMDWMKNTPDNFYSFAIVDPPYGIGINKSGRLGHYGGKKKWDDAIPKDNYFEELFRVSKNQIIWGGNYFNLPPCKCFLIWDKKQPPGISFADSEYAWSSFKTPSKTFRLFPVKADKVRIHPTQKPVKLYKWILKKYGKEGDNILDTHGGSGSICIACHDLQYDLDWMELDEDYYESASNRYNEHASKIENSIKNLNNKLFY